MGRANSVKDRILNTASRLFYKRGFNSTGINQIIAEAGIAIGSMYKHYQSKNDLLYHYLQNEELEYFNNLESFLKNEEQPVQRLLKLIDYRIQIQQKADYSGCHFIKINAEIGRQDKRVEQLVVEHKWKQREYIDKIITEISLVQDLPMEKGSLVNSVFLMMEGAVVSSGIHGNTEDLKAIRTVINQLF